MRILKQICFLGVVFLFPGILFSDDNKKILVINSDVSVERYVMVHEEFRKKIPYPIAEVNLEDSKWKKPNNIKAMINNENPDLVYCIGTKAYVIASKYAPEKNLVFSSILNWRRLPLTKKTYGISNELHTGMQIMLFRYMFPHIKKIGVLYGKQYNRQWVAEATEAAKKTCIELVCEAISDSKETIPALEKLLLRTDSFWLIADPVIMSEKKILGQVLKTCNARKKPIFSYHSAFAKYGAILIVSADDKTIGGQAATIAEEVLSRVDIEEKVQFPAGSQITLNLKKAKEYGLKYNEDALDSVNSIIK
ncbi:ABC transporter substrate binding protein [Desulfococcaceae bacterium HSG8]|nr:ABC transporter substrate binding protein [Desulfococcaceae bacterium HSG8]